MGQDNLLTPQNGVGEVMGDNEGRYLIQQQHSRRPFPIRQENNPTAYNNALGFNNVTSMSQSMSEAVYMDQQGWALPNTGQKFFPFVHRYAKFEQQAHERTTTSSNEQHAATQQERRRMC